jgi:hypothetical protein
MLHHLNLQRRIVFHRSHKQVDRHRLRQCLALCTMYKELHRLYLHGPRTTLVLAWDISQTSLVLLQSHTTAIIISLFSNRNRDRRSLQFFKMILAARNQLSVSRLNMNQVQTARHLHSSRPSLQSIKNVSNANGNVNMSVPSANVNANVNGRSVFNINASEVIFSPGSGFKQRKMVELRYCESNRNSCTVAQATRTLFWAQVPIQLLLCTDLEGQMRCVPSKEQLLVISMAVHLDLLQAG